MFCQLTGIFIHFRIWADIIRPIYLTIHVN